MINEHTISITSKDELLKAVELKKGKAARKTGVTTQCTAQSRDENIPIFFNKFNRCVFLVSHIINATLLQIYKFATN